MRFHQVKVDDEVFQFVQAHAKPLVDDFNSALRRLLALSNASLQRRPDVIRGPRPGVLRSLPNGTPIALRHILEVTHLVRSGAYSRTGATQFVARQHNVFPQTVIDKYGRQLGLTASQFDRLVEQEHPSELRTLLKAKFPDHNDLIDQFLE
jgi:hypothetical protein